MKLLIARHGNTFLPDETPRRVGQHTDIPLVASGIEQADSLGHYLKNNNLIPDVIYCSELMRTQQTAQGIVDVLKKTIPVHIDDRFNEIDYGVDENKTEAEVIARVGKDAIVAWDTAATVPDGWQIDPEQIKQQWQQFAKAQLDSTNVQTVLVVTSNGIARFAPCLLPDEQVFDAQYARKIATGALCQLSYQENQWQTDLWNYRAKTKSLSI